MGAPVILNVYDLHDNSWIYWCGIGIFHSGVEVYDVEYAYGGHEYDMSGVFATNPRDAPGPVVWRESVVIGETSLGAQEVQEVVQQLGSEYKGTAYHLLERNCNHFSNELCMKLTGKPAPSWVNRLAGMAIMLHCLLPTSWVPPLSPPTAQPLLEERHVEERENLLRDRTPSDRQQGNPVH
ncbi:g4862 [Coccomyxa viridis]|uniref:G4862 protein n=1 Tax=Coccomyxa viridis TaxID=1274662 RepID=A0ABP1FRB8_9CHLO